MKPALLPTVFGLLALAILEAAVHLAQIPVYLLPGPIAIVGAFLADPWGLMVSLGSTLAVTFAALVVAAVLGVAMALAMLSGAARTERSGAVCNSASHITSNPAVSAASTSSNDSVNALASL